MITMVIRLLVYGHAGGSKNSKLQLQNDTFGFHWKDFLTMYYYDGQEGIF